MSPATIALNPRAVTRTRRVLISLTLSLSFTSVSCGSSEPKTEVRGVVEVVDAKGASNGVESIEAKDASSEVELIEPLCITNTPTHEPC
jgi:hypothetical protein